MEDHGADADAEEEEEVLPYDDNDPGLLAKEVQTLMRDRKGEGRHRDREGRYRDGGEQQDRELRLKNRELRRKDRDGDGEGDRDRDRDRERDRDRDGDGGGDQKLRHASGASVSVSSLKSQSESSSHSHALSLSKPNYLTLAAALGAALDGGSDSASVGSDKGLVVVTSLHSHPLLVQATGATQFNESTRRIQKNLGHNSDHKRQESQERHKRQERHSQQLGRDSRGSSRDMLGSRVGVGEVEGGKDTRARTSEDPPYPDNHDAFEYVDANSDGVPDSPDNDAAFEYDMYQGGTGDADVLSAGAEMTSISQRSSLADFFASRRNDHILSHAHSLSHSQPFDSHHQGTSTRGTFNGANNGDSAYEEARTARNGVGGGASLEDAQNEYFEAPMNSGGSYCRKAGDGAGNALADATNTTATPTTPASSPAYHYTPSAAPKSTRPTGSASGSDNVSGAFPSAQDALAFAAQYREEIAELNRKLNILQLPFLADNEALSRKAGRVEAENGVLRSADLMGPFAEANRLLLAELSELMHQNEEMEVQVEALGGILNPSHR
mmetsp:Transcript_26330/g.58291  ORF Transcript_26330/g.58291 Transcript_26330/m.58291 type:complete len:553 (+) Transcript_26330:147-1805(+)